MKTIEYNAHCLFIHLHVIAPAIISLEVIICRYTLWLKSEIMI